MRLIGFLILFSIVLTSVFWRLHIAERKAQGTAVWSSEAAPAAATDNDSITMVRAGQGVVEADGDEAAGAVLIDSDGKRYTIALSQRRQTAASARAKTPPAPRDPRTARRTALALTAGILALGAAAVFFARKRLLGR